jgi:hypothetical protein
VLAACELAACEDDLEKDVSSEDVFHLASSTMCIHTIVTGSEWVDHVYFAVQDALLGVFQLRYQVSWSQSWIAIVRIDRSVRQHRQCL